MKITILFDNYQFNKKLQSLWGFSCLIETNKTILLDTGSNGRVLLQNAKKLNIDFAKIDILFITHPHWDHIGGLDTIIEENPNIELILPNSLSIHLIEDLKTLVKKVRIIDNNFTQFGKNLYSTGVMEPIGEQSLIIQHNNELFVITGCGHPGIDAIQNKTLSNINKKIKFTIGGFHLLKNTPQEIQKIIHNIQSDYITATHCTGDIAIKMIKNIYKERFLDGGVGACFSF